MLSEADLSLAKDQRVETSLSSGQLYVKCCWDKADIGARSDPSTSLRMTKSVEVLEVPGKAKHTDGQRSDVHPTRTSVMLSEADLSLAKDQKAGTSLSSRWFYIQYG